MRWSNKSLKRIAEKGGSRLASTLDLLKENETTRKGKIRWLRIAYRTGAVLDAVAFLQMMFPRFTAETMKVNFEVTPAYEMAMQFGAALMLAWTVLLVWADRRPVERKAIVPITLIILVLNFITFLQSAHRGLVPMETLVPQLIIIALVFFLYVFAWLHTRNMEITEQSQTFRETKKV